MRVFITGGTGLLGSHLVQEVRSYGWDVVALHRRDADTLFIEEHDCELRFFPGELTGPQGAVKVRYLVRMRSDGSIGFAVVPEVEGVIALDVARTLALRLDVTPPWL